MSFFFPFVRGWVNVLERACGCCSGKIDTGGGGLCSLIFGCVFSDGETRRRDSVIWERMRLIGIDQCGNNHMLIFCEGCVT